MIDYTRIVLAFDEPAHGESGRFHIVQGNRGNLGYSFLIGSSEQRFEHGGDTFAFLCAIADGKYAVPSLPSSWHRVPSAVIALENFRLRTSGSYCIAGSAAQRLELSVDEGSFSSCKRRTEVGEFTTELFRAAANWRAPLSELYMGQRRPRVADAPQEHISTPHSGLPQRAGALLVVPNAVFRDLSVVAGPRRIIQRESA